MLLMKNIINYLINYKFKKIFIFIKHKLQRPIIFWPVRFGIDWLVIILSYFYRGNLNQSWKTYVLKTEGNFKNKGKEAEENNLIICIIKYCKVSTVEKLLSKEDLEIKYIDTNLKHSRRIIVNDFANTNPYPSSISINTERNSEELSGIFSNLR